MKVCVYVCMYVCINVCVHVCMYVCMYVCMHVYTYVYTHVRMYVGVDNYRNVCTNVCVYVCVCVLVRDDSCVCAQARSGHGGVHPHLSLAVLWARHKSINVSLSFRALRASTP